MMRRKFHGRRRRPPMQWVPSGSYGTSVTPGVGAQTTLITLVDGASGFSGTTQPQPTIARMTVVCVRGQLLMGFTVSTEQAFAGIIVLDSGTTAATAPSPVTQAGADAPWMWLRMYQSETNSGLVSNMTYDGGADVFVKSKRILRPNQRLFLVVQSTFGATSTFLPQLRTLISRVA